MLEYCGYIGGLSSDDNTTGIDVDSAGRAVVVGRTSSTEGTWSAKVGPSLTQSGKEDGFIARVRADGTGFEYNGFLGGETFDELDCVIVGPGGEAYVAGYTNSTEQTGFPVKIGPSLVNAGEHDVIVARVAADGSGFDWCGFFGGASSEYALGIDLYGGDVFLAGSTNSDETSFPVKVGPELVYGGPQSDGFVARLKGDGTGVVWCGYVVGTFVEILVDVEVDDGGRAWFAGRTATADDDPVPPPLVNGPDDTHNGGLDGFVGRVTPDGSAFDFAGYVGGDDSDQFAALAIAGAQNGTVSAWLVGNTESTEATFPAIGGGDLTQNGDKDGFLLRIDATVGANPQPDVVTLDLLGKKGLLKDAEKAGKDKFTYKGTLTFRDESPDRIFDPTAEAMAIRVGSEGAVYEHVVPAGDPGWKITKKGLKWKGSIGAVSYKTKNGKFALKLKKFDFPGAQTPPLVFSFALGNDLARPGDAWVQKKPGRLKFSR